jgi:hypothetical protein
MGLAGNTPIGPSQYTGNRKRTTGGRGGAGAHGRPLADTGTSGASRWWRSDSSAPSSKSSSACMRVRAARARIVVRGPVPAPVAGGDGRSATRPL